MMCVERYRVRLPRVWGVGYLSACFPFRGQKIATAARPGKKRPQEHGPDSRMDFGGESDRRWRRNPQVGRGSWRLRSQGKDSGSTEVMRPFGSKSACDPNSRAVVDSVQGDGASRSPYRSRRKETFHFAQTELASSQYATTVAIYGTDQGGSYAT